MDIATTNEGNIVTVRPTSPRGKAWLDENVEAAPWQWLGDVLCVDHALAGDLIAGMRADGLTVG